MLENANADQINAVSEMVLNLLRNRIPVHPITMAKLLRYKTMIREEPQKFGQDAKKTSPRTKR